MGKEEGIKSTMPTKRLSRSESAAHERTNERVGNAPKFNKSRGRETVSHSQPKDVKEETREMDDKIRKRDE